MLLFIGFLAIILLSILIFPVLSAIPFFSTVDAALWLQMDWNPSSGVYGIGASLLGSASVVAISLPLTLAIGWLLGYQLAHNRNRKIYPVSVAILETWLALPSVVIGIWAITQLVPLVRMIEGSGYCLLAASLGLAIFCVPMSTLLFYRSYSAYQTHFRLLEASHALSMWGKTEMFFKSRPRVLVSTANYCFCRLFGETMIVLMLSGNSTQVPSSVFEGVRTLTATIALEMDYASGNHERALFALSVIGIAVVLLVILPQFRRSSHA